MRGPGCRGRGRREAPPAMCDAPCARVAAMLSQQRSDRYGSRRVCSLQAATSA